MICLASGDILRHDAEALVNAVNCVGVMGAGLAMQFRRAFPDNFDAYRAAFRRGELRPGRMFVFERARVDPPRWIINFPTKRHWKDRSQPGDIKSGLADLVSAIQDRGVRSIALPPLGCGLGGLDWMLVRPLIEDALGDMPGVNVHLFGP